MGRRIFVSFTSNETKSHHDVYLFIYSFLFVFFYSHHTTPHHTTPHHITSLYSGGALIAPSVVLFAAHCQDFKDQQVNVGSFKRRSSNFGAQPAFCDVWIDDPTFGNGGSSINNDFALCLLDRDVIIDQTKVKLILNTNPAVPASSGDDLTVMGLGTLSAGGDSRK